VHRKRTQSIRVRWARAAAESDFGATLDAFRQCPSGLADRVPALMATREIAQPLRRWRAGSRSAKSELFRVMRDPQICLIT